MPHRLLQFEHRRQPVIGVMAFYRRVLRNLFFGCAIVFVSLAFGMAGYMVLEDNSLLDAFQSASMILAGMGPVGEVRTAGGKLFAGLYALYSGLVLIFITGILLAPLAHRVLHRFNVETDDAKESQARRTGVPDR